MRQHNKLAADVDLLDLAKRTRNFSGAEIEGLVRSAQATAMNKLIKVSKASQLAGQPIGMVILPSSSTPPLLLPLFQAKEKVTVTHEDADRLRVTMMDFDHALLYDLKPAFGISDKQLDSYVYNGTLLYQIPKPIDIIIVCTVLFVCVCVCIVCVCRGDPLGAQGAGDPGPWEGGSVCGGSQPAHPAGEPAAEGGPRLRQDCPGSLRGQALRVPLCQDTLSGGHGRFQ